MPKEPKSPHSMSVCQEMMILLVNRIPSPTKRNIWKITPKRTASRTSAILQMMAFQV